jgi:LysM repeat protein
MIKIARYLSIFVLLLITTIVYSQKINTTEYVKKYKSLAISEMDKFNIPASIILAQGILESGNGNSRLAKNGKNHFGIKCHNNWNGKTIRWNDDSKRECFRKYKSVAESYRDHSEFLSNRGHYSPLFKLSMTDYKGWAKGLQKAGYATNNRYSTLLIRIIEENNLHQFDNPNLFAKNSNTKQPTNSSEISSLSDSDFEPIDICGSNRPLYTNNGVKFIFAEAGDNFAKIARELNIYTWQVYKYNDLKKDDSIVKGQMIYLQKKKRKASQKYHLTKSNETLYSIAQLYGIQLKVLRSKNKLDINDSAQIGQQLKLK